MTFKVTINAIGKIIQKELITLNEEYLKRIKWEVRLNEFNQDFKGCNLNSKKQKAKKSLALNSRIYTFALDEKGKQYSSYEFANHLKSLKDKGFNDITFLIGGADGLSADTKSTADEVFSLGKLTLPHKLARLILIEQIYRAFTICTGHPYHRQ